ncbi:glycosyltransferase [Aliiroseovarius sp. S253]|uniref:glycosyltransferase n=1 Tax=Aliiroseovarius sp. S253 TaxID=3415133 RepID=UPI003C7A31BE
MFRKTIIHLCDDQTSGGVTRVLEHIQSCPIIRASGDRHIVKFVKRGSTKIGRLNADVIVSHLSVSWRTLPGHVVLRALNPNTPMIHVEHSYTEAFVARNVLRKARFNTLLRSAYALYDKVVAVSYAQGRWLATAGLVRPSQLGVIQSTVSYDTMRAIPAPKGETRVFGAIGRLDHQKGFDTLISAFKNVTTPNAKLRIYGTGPEEENLKRLAQDDPRISFEGHHSDACRIYGEIDAVLMPSRWEAYGLVAAEALTAKRPVLAQAVDGLVDHVEFGAHLVNSSDIEAWTVAIDTAARKKIAIVATCNVTQSPEKNFATAWSKLVKDLCGELDTPSPFKPVPLRS